MNTHGETSPVLMPGKLGEEAPHDLGRAGWSNLPTIPDHELLRHIGEGSFGEVWLARNKLGTLRAVKIVHRMNFEDSRPFEREFKGIQKFEPISRSHEGLVDILQVGGTEDYFYCIMELADDANAEQVVSLPVSDAKQVEPQTGKLPVLTYTPRTLRSEAKQRCRLPINECVKIGQALASALTHLHEQGLVHRDVKPSNIIFVGGVPKLADIGLVAEASEARSFVGTEGFIPPEGPGAPHADLYSLGKVLYEISTGNDRRDFPVLPDDLAEDEVMLELNAIILKACKLDVRHRYQSAAEVGADLVLLQRGKSVKRKRALQHYWAASRRAGLVLSVLTVAMSLSVGLLHRLSDTDLHSAIPGVDALVAQGDQVALSGVPDRLDQAWKDYSKAAVLDPKFAPAYVGLFNVRMGQYTGTSDPPADAESNLRVAATNLIRIAPDLAESKLASALLKYRDGHLEGALADAHQATRMRLASKAGAGLAHAAYGWYLMNAGRTDDALRELLLAEQATHADPIILYQLGNVYFVKHQFPQALERFQNAIDLEPRQYWGYFGMGCVFEETGQFEKAINQFELGDRAVGRKEAQTKDFYNELHAAIKRDPIQGYWEERLKQLLSNSPEHDHAIAIVLAHLRRTDEAYDRLKRASDKGRLEGLWFDPCWDHKDERFKLIAKKVSMKP